MIPQFTYFFYPILSLLMDGQAHNYKELQSYVKEHFGFSDEEMEQRTKKGNQRVVYDRIQWTCTYFRHAGLIESGIRGVAKITQLGKDLYPTVDESMGIETLKQFESFVKFMKPKKSGTEPNSHTTSNEDDSNNDKTPSEDMENAYNEIRNELAESILETVKSKSPLFFEQLVLDLLKAMGYGGSIDNSTTLTKGSHDEGIDGIIKEDKLGLDKIYIQAKRYDNVTVGRKEVQSFCGAISGKGGTKGVFITTSQFSKEALAFNPTNIKLVLIDGILLANYLIDYNVGVYSRRVYEIKEIDRDYFNEE